MAHRVIRVTRPGPIRHDFANPFVTELCPICYTNRLGPALKFPVCHKCREQLELTEDLLMELKAHRLLINQDTIDWQEKPRPTLTGRIDDVDWKAVFVFGGWSIIWCEGQPVEDRSTLACLIKQYIDKVTPAWLERARTSKTPIRRYRFFIATGVAASAVIVTAAILAKKRADRLKTEQGEAEKAE